MRNRLPSGAIVALALAATPVVASSELFVARGAQVVGDPVVPRLVQVDLRELPVAAAWQPGDPIKGVPRRRHPRSEAPVPEPWTGPDPLLALPAPEAPLGLGVQEVLDFAGQGFSGVNPPDTVGDVGPGLFIQSINGGSGALVRVHDSSNGSVVAGPFAMDSLGTGACASGFGDPVVLYDELADRWLLSEFASGGNHLCVYISQTSDPVAGGWFAYDFSTPSFPDYPKYGVWPDAYYVTTNESSPAIYALDRARMLTGAAATMQRFTAPSLPSFPFEALTPADHDGDTPPPPGAPGIIVRHRDTEVHGPPSTPTHDLLEIFEFHVDWTTPANSTFTQLPSIQIAEFDSDLCGLVAFACVPQPGTGVLLDPLREVVMFRLAYRRNGSTDVLVGNFATDVDGTDHTGTRWFELRNGGSGWSLFQEGTLAPDADHRWMGGIAMDSAGNILLGYNVSGSATFPGLRYTGRHSFDPPGTLAPEAVLVAGGASNGSNRYGDYSSMSVDPVDGCTFWFTGEYNTTSQWSTRIGALKFDACGLPDFTLSATPPTLDVCVPDDGEYLVQVGSVADYDEAVTLSVSGNPTGTSVAFSTNPVTPPGTSTMTISGTGGAAPGSSTITITGTAIGPNVHTTDVALVLVEDPPAAPALVAPADGATDVSLAPTLSWSAAAGAVTYEVEVDDDPGFGSPEFTATTSATTVVANGLVPEMLYHWRVTASNVCGEGEASEVFEFTTRALPPVLLVDDDDNSPDVRATYTAALDALGVGYDLWDTVNTDNEPTAADLAGYQHVVWFTGDEFGGAAGPGSAGEAALAAYLDGGGCLFLSSQDYHFDRGFTSFMQNYLGAASITNDSGDYTSVTGVAGTIFAGMGPFTLSYPFTDFADIVSAGPSAVTVLDGNNGNDAALRKDAGTYATVFFGFPWEAITPATAREAVLDAVLGACAPVAPDRTLEVTVDGPGEVTSSPGGIDCPGDCTEAFPDGTPVTLTATAEPGALFVGWSGACTGTGSCLLTMSTDRSVTATFDTMPFVDGFETGDTGRWSATQP